MSGPGRPALSARTRLVGVMGDPVAHSLSPLLHNAAFAALGLDWVSLGFLVPEGAAGAALSGMRALGLAGLSVTMPHKAAVVALVDELRRPELAALGALNCVRRCEGRLVGDNTDGAGFLGALAERPGFDPAGRRCLVVGAGGAARAVVLALAGAGAAEVVVVNRSAGRAEAAAALAGGRGRTGAAAEAAGMDLVVNATPAGMAGSASAGAAVAVGPDQLHRGQVVVDLVYHPRRTAWMAAAAARGAVVVGGLGMLVHQAAAQLAWWTGTDPPLEAMWAAVEVELGPAP